MGSVGAGHPKEKETDNMSGHQTHIMTTETGIWLLVIFAILWVLLGMWWGRKVKDNEGFMLAGRNVGLALGAATAMATWITSNTVMLAPLFALEHGVWGMLAYATASLGLILFAPMAMRIQRLLPKGFTSGDFIRLRFGRVAWSLFLLITLFYSIIWLVTMAIAGGTFIQALSGIPYLTGMTVILLACVLYTIFGGLFAVIGTDFVQSLIIMVGIVIIGIAVLTQVNIPDMHAHMVEFQPALLDVLMPAALLIFFNSMIFGFGEIFHNNVWWSRAYAMRRGVAKKAFVISGLLWIPVPIAAGYIALSSGVLGINIPDGNMTGPLVASHVLGATGAANLAGILIFVVLFCALASSIDSLLAATSDLVTEDIVRKWCGVDLSDKGARIVGMLVIFGIGLVAWGIAYPGRGLIGVLLLAGPLVASVIWPVIGGLYWRRLSGGAAAAAMFFGSAVGLLAYVQIGPYTGAVASALVSMLIVVIGRRAATGAYEWSLLDESRIQPKNKSK